MKDDSLKWAALAAAFAVCFLCFSYLLISDLSKGPLSSEVSLSTEVHCFFVGELPGTSRKLEFWRCRDDVSDTCFLLMYPLDGVAPTPTPCN